ncbi:MAG: hypothetical protein O7B35_00450 [Deltaproteobacteria bacterium]|nr:hypothetical protein [Deltaproteobacteria bacterium]
MKPSNTGPSIASADGIAGRVFLRPWALVLALLVAPTMVQAQDQAPCEDIISEAADLYIAERFDAVISRLQECLNQNALNVEDKPLAYEILAKSHLKLGSEDRARAALTDLLTLVPDYKPDQFEDEQYKNLVEEVRRTVVTPLVEKEKESGLLRWLLIGGGAVATGAAVYVLTRNGNGTTFPPPPPRPGGN